MATVLLSFNFGLKTNWSKSRRSKSNAFGTMDLRKKFLKIEKMVIPSSISGKRVSPSGVLSEAVVTALMYTCRHTHYCNY